MPKASAHDVAKYIVQKLGQVSPMKLQKLVYYSQAWALVWDDGPIFSENIEAWANGPVVPKLYSIHRGEFCIIDWPRGDISKLSKDSKQTIDAVIKFYGKKNAQELSDLTHRESPWIQARGGVAPGERGNNTISLESMAEYYSSLGV